MVFRLASALGKLLAALTMAMSWAPAGYGGNTWDGGGANNNWTTGQNWNPATGAFQIPPFNNGFADVVMAGTLRLTPLIDVPYSIRSLTFDNTAGSFTILGVEELMIGAGGITNNNTQLQSVIGPVKLSANQIWTAAAGRLQTDAITLNGFDLGLAGARQIELPNIILGAGDITLADSYTSTVTMLGPGSNTYAGHTDVQGGTLVLQKGGVAVPGDLTIGAGGTVRLAGNEQIAEAAGNEVVVLGGGLLDVNVRTETVRRLVLNGGAATTSGAGRLYSEDVLVTGATASWNNAGNLHVGDLAAGTLEIVAGGDVVNTIGFIGNRANAVGEVTITGLGSTWTNNADLNVGYFGAGSVHVSGGAQVTSAAGYLGFQSGSSGQVVVDGAGSSLTPSHSMHVGNLGVGTLTIQNGGAVSNGIGYVGNQAGSIGTVTVSGAGSVWTSSADLYVGNAGQGTVNITGGGDLFSPRAYVGYTAGSMGTVNVSGVHSDWVIRDSASPGQSELSIGSAGDGFLNITAGGSVRCSGDVIMASGSKVVVDGMGSSLSLSNHFIYNPFEPDLSAVFGGKLELSANGELEVRNGGRVTSVEGKTGPASIVRVHGADSHWWIHEASAPNSTGHGGTLDIDGILDVADAAIVQIQGYLGIGRSSAGQLSITSGGQVMSDGGASLGFLPGSSAHATVDGAGSQWSNAGILIIGHFGEGTVNITAGGSITSGSGSIGSQAGSTGDVMIDGTGSTWSNSGELRVGVVGVGTLEISNGAFVNNNDTTIGVASGSTGLVHVSGLGSVLATTETLTVGGLGSGRLLLGNGAVASATELIVGARGEVRGDGNIVGNVENNGLVSPGGSAGVLSISHSFVQTSPGELQIELASFASYDQLIVADNATLGGALAVNLLDGFVPTPGQTFTIITADDIDGVFATEVLPSVPGLVLDVIYNPQSVVLTVSPEFTADFDEDGDVDGADLAQWEGDFGMNHFSDADDDGDSDGADFLAWQQQLGSGAPAVPSAAVPEPATLWLLLFLFGGRRSALNKYMR